MYGCNQKDKKRFSKNCKKQRKTKINVDRTGKLDGRGAYIADNIECLVIKTKD